MSCGVDGCDRPVLARGWCKRHYELARRNGVPEMRLTARGRPLGFIRDCLATEQEACISWPFAQYSKGYGSVWYQGKLTGAHRLVCILAHGEPPSGTEAGHSCGNRLCVNPKHIRWVSAVENAADKRIHGTDNAGSDNPQAKLDWSKVNEIRRLSADGHSYAALGRRFGVSSGTIRLVAIGETWKNDLSDFVTDEKVAMLRAG